MFGHMRLGRRSPRPGLAVPRLADHRRAALPPPPAAVPVPAMPGGWIMGQNDRYGDCTVVACANAILRWTAANGDPFRVSDATILARYALASGYVPGRPETDQGAIETDVLRLWSSRGWQIGRPTGDVTLWAALDPRDHNAVRQAIHAFGGVYIGLALPVAAQNQLVWDVPEGGPHGDGAPGGWGGHAVFVVGYDQRGPTCITWGETLRMSWAFWDAYCDEAYALLDRNDWLDTKGHAGSLDFGGLAAALALL